MNAPVPVPDANVTRRFDLRAGDVFRLHGRTCEFERRLDERLQFLKVADKDVLFLSDEQLAFMFGRGDAIVIAGSGRWERMSEGTLARLALTPEQDAEADRKLEYVLACLRGHLDHERRPLCEHVFRRSRPSNNPLIARLAERRGEAAPDFTTVLEWIDRWVLLGDVQGKACLVARTWERGNRTGRVGHIGELALSRGLARWLTPNMSQIVAFAKVLTTVAAYKRKLRGHLTRDDLDAIRAPSLSTFQRRCAEIDRYTKAYYRRGPTYANKMRTYETRPLSERPYQDVEVDHCTLDILLVDDDTDLVLGRPDLILFKDRATGMVIGRTVGFEAPSYASFVAGLRHAMYPKDMSDRPGITVPYPCYGRIENLWVDNALHFILRQIEECCRELKIDKPQFRPGSPGMKGALERFFGFQNTGLVHMLPGTTLSNAVQRGEYDPELLEGAKIRRTDFDRMLDWFICHVANAGLSRGLGLIRGLGDVPLRAWAEKAAKYPSGPLPPAELFVALAGEHKMCTIQNDGIVWDYIRYESPELITLLTHPRHRGGGDRGATTQYRCHRDPSDLGRIYVTNPHEPTRPTIIVPATLAHAAYAEGLHRHVHDVTRAHARRIREDALDVETLMRVRDRLADIAVGARKGRERQGVQKRIARFLDGERTRRRASAVMAAAPPDGSTGAHLDPLAYAGRKVPRQPAPALTPAPPLPAGASSAPAPTATADAPAVPQSYSTSPPGASTPPAAPTTPPPDAAAYDDLAALRKRHQWSTNDG